ncbi:hypothetical protein F4803DRAFT_525189 [Xylaria telfairii]|nr:hypothetical protein F4803DRAFT_525189 [Xylaria telfairii]
MTSAENWAIPKGSTVLVTGVSGFIGSHIADQFLHHGFRVRGTSREPKKHVWLSNLFNKKYSLGSFELCQVSDMAVPGAFNMVVKGVSAVVHTASIMTFDSDPNKVIPGVIAFALNALKATYSESSAKRFVFCSSATAAVQSVLGRPSIVVTEETWNEVAIKDAWAGTALDIDPSHVVYSASKVLAEKAIWKYYNENAHIRPDIVVNTVLPNMTLGTSIDAINHGFPSTSGMVALLYRGEISPYHMSVPRQYFVDVQDVGRLHVAAAILPNVQRQRIFAFAERYSWDSILDIFRKLEPNKTFVGNFSGGEDPNVIGPQGKAEQLLRDLGRAGWTHLEESIRNIVRDLQILERGIMNA